MTAWRIRLGRSKLVAVREGTVEIQRATIDDLEGLQAIDVKVAAGDAGRISAIRAYVSNGFCWVASVQVDFDEL